MHKLYELRDKLCDELISFTDKGVSSGNLSTIDTLAHAIKNVDKIIECDEGDEYSSRAYPDGMGGSYRRSYARGRDRMGRYSGNDGMDDKESIRHEIKRLEDRLNRM